MNNTKNVSRNTLKKSSDATLIVTKTVERTEVIFKKKLEKVNEMLSKTVFKK